MALITPIQSTGDHSLGTVASISKAFPGDVTAGNVLIVEGGVWFTGDVNTVSDSLGTVYTLMGSATKIRYWYGIAPSSGPCTVTVQRLAGDNYLQIGIMEIPAGSYTYTLAGISTSSTSTPSTPNFTVTDTGSLLLAALTCQGDPSGTITEDGAWTLITESTNYSYLPYSWIWRNADPGSVGASWTLGANITTYREGLMIEGTPTAPEKRVGIIGKNGKVTSHSTVLLNLDETIRTVDEPETLFVGGHLIVTGDTTVEDLTINGTFTLPADSVTNTELANMAQATIKGRASGAGTGDPTDLTANQVSTILDAATDPFVRTSAMTGGGSDRTFGITIDGGGSVISTGVKGFVQVPYAGTITASTLLSTDAGSTAGAIVIDVWRDTYANYPPVNADSITASAPPTLSGTNKATDSTLTGWNTTVTAGDVFGFNVDSATTVTRVTLMLTVTP